jgi:hypothetical protein
MLNIQRYMLKTALVFLPLFTAFSNRSEAQAVNTCLTNSISINTGVDPSTGAMLPHGTSDPKWTVSGLSAMNLPFAPSTMFPYSASVVMPASLWATSTVSGWLSFLDTNGYATTTGGYYTDTFKRCFSTCVADSIEFSLQVACDDRIDNIYVDGINIYAGQPPAPNTPNLSTINSTPSRKLWLVPGQHCIVVAAMNYPWPSTANNWNGLNIIGSVSSVSGSNSIVSEHAGCNSYVCNSGQDTTGEGTGTTGTKHLLSDDFGYVVFPNPSSGHFIITQNVQQENAIVTARMTNIAGSTIVNAQLKFINGKCDFKSPADLPAGMYILSLSEEGGSTYFSKILVR